MNLVLVFPLILAFLGQSHTALIAATSQSCNKNCSAGYYCKHDESAKCKCEKCPNNTYTAKENHHDKCFRCDSCIRPEVEIKPCTYNCNVVCDCMDGYYYEGHDPDLRACKSCDEVSINNADYKRKCSKSKSLNDPKCPPDVTLPSVPSESTTMFTQSSTMMATNTRSTLSSTKFNPIIDPIPPKGTYVSWIVLLAVILVLVFLPLVLKNLLEPPGSCHCWSAKKNVEQHAGNPIFSEQHSHQGNCSTTLTLNICEENPVMTLSQSPSSEHPAHMSPLLPHTEDKAARPEQSKHLPAFVHYEIIKEVPLRRWKEFLRLLSVDDRELERAELEAGLGVGSMERQYQMLRLWSQRPSASLNDVFSALHYMELSGCAQQLQENLEKLQWWAESKQGFTACGNYTDQGFSGAMQDT